MAIMVLVGCGTVVPDTLPPDFELGMNPRSGVVIGSVTATRVGRGWYMASRYDFQAAAEPKLRGTLKSGQRGSMIPFAHLSTPKHYTDCRDDGLVEACGRLFAMELPAGDYEGPRSLD